MDLYILRGTHCCLVMFHWRPQTPMFPWWCHEEDSTVYKHCKQRWIPRVIYYLFSLSQFDLDRRSCPHELFQNQWSGIKRCPFIKLHLWEFLLHFWREGSYKSCGAFLWQVLTFFLCSEILSSVHRLAEAERFITVAGMASGSKDVLKICRAEMPDCISAMLYIAPKLP